MFRAQAIVCARGITRFHEPICTVFFSCSFSFVFASFLVFINLFSFLLFAVFAFVLLIPPVLCFFASFPRTCLLLRHCICNTLLFWFCCVLFVCPLFFLRHKNRCTRRSGPTACVHWPCCFGLVACVLTCFCPVSFVFGFWWTIPRWCDLGCTLFHLFLVFVAGLLPCFFIFAKTRRWHACQNIVFPAYWEPPIPSFCAPPAPYYVTVSIHTIRVHSFTCGLVYVHVASVHVCVLPMFACWRVVRMCVCRRRWCINVCVRGIMC